MKNNYIKLIVKLLMTEVNETMKNTYIDPLATDQQVIKCMEYFEKHLENVEANFMMHARTMFIVNNETRIRKGPKGEIWNYSSKNPGGNCINVEFKGYEINCKPFSSTITFYLKTSILKKNNNINKEFKLNFVNDMDELLETHEDKLNNDIFFDYIERYDTTLTP